jgi:hypothetical protein
VVGSSETETKAVSMVRSDGGLRSRFVAVWPRFERIGLRITGIWLVFLGLATTLAGLDIPNGLLISVWPGAALIIAGVLAFDGSRHDLIRGTLAGLAALLLAVGIAASQTADPQALNADAYVPALIMLGVPLWAIEAFRGAFRDRQSSPHDNPE